MNKFLVTLLTASTIVLACYKPQTTPIATAAVTVAIQSLAKDEHKKDREQPVK